MANVYHLSFRETTGENRRWTVRAELWQSSAEQRQRTLPIANLAFHLEGTGKPMAGLAAFFPFALLAAMRAGVPLIVDGSLPVEWKRSGQRFQELVGSWFPSFTPVGVEAGWEEQPVAPFQSGHGVVFTSGLDCFHALHSSAPTHLVYLGKLRAGDEFRVAAREVAARMDLPVISVDSEIHSDHPLMIDPADFPAVNVSAALNILAGQLSQFTWGSPRGWLSPAGGGDHFALAECFLAQNTGLRLTGRGTTRLEKWRAVADMPLAREFLRVGCCAPCDSTSDGQCPECLSARLALRVLGFESGWPGLSGGDALDRHALIGCIAHDRESCAQAHDLLRQRAPDSELLTLLGACLDQSKLDHWARELAALGARATTTPIWPKLSRRLLPQVLATAASGDPAWLRSVAGLHEATVELPDE